MFLGGVQNEKSNCECVFIQAEPVFVEKTVLAPKKKKQPEQPLLNTGGVLNRVDRITKILLKAIERIPENYCDAVSHLKPCYFAPANKSINIVAGGDKNGTNLF